MLPGDNGGTFGGTAAAAVAAGSLAGWYTYLAAIQGRASPNCCAQSYAVAAVHCPAHGDHHPMPHDGSQGNSLNSLPATHHSDRALAVALIAAI